MVVKVPRWGTQTGTREPRRALPRRDRRDGRLRRAPGRPTRWTSSTDRTGPATSAAAAHGVPRDGVARGDVVHAGRAVGAGDAHGGSPGTAASPPPLTSLPAIVVDTALGVGCAPLRHALVLRCCPCCPCSLQMSRWRRSRGRSHGPPRRDTRCARTAPAPRLEDLRQRVWPPAYSTTTTWKPAASRTGRRCGTAMLVASAIWSGWSRRGLYRPKQLFDRFPAPTIPGPASEAATNSFSKLCTVSDNAKGLDRSPMCAGPVCSLRTIRSPVGYSLDHAMRTSHASCSSLTLAVAPAMPRSGQKGAVIYHGVRAYTSPGGVNETKVKERRLSGRRSSRGIDTDSAHGKQLLWR